MRILVTGASGFLGFHLVRHLEARHDVLGCFSSRSVTFGTAAAAKLDFTDPGECLEVIRGFSPTHIVHAGAMTQTGECEKEPDRAWKVNVEGTQNILAAAAALSPVAHVTLISTDLVFNGTLPGGLYVEAHTPDPVMVYGRSKREAERFLARWCATSGHEGAVLRSALIYGPPDAPRPCFLEWMLQGIRNSQGALFTDEYRSPVPVSSLCATIEQAALKKARGCFHVGGAERLSRYQFGLLAAEAFRINPDLVRGARSADVPTGSPRPADVSLNITKARIQLGHNPPPTPIALRQLAAAGFYAENTPVS